VAAGLVAVRGTASAKEACLKYEPEIVTLVGVTTRQTFPGPPNYESVKNGDRPERCWLLRLPRPVCVRPSNPADDIQEAESGVTLLQIIIPDYKSVRPLLGRKVRIIGTLMHAITGHHHTKVLIDASMIEAVR
jgi:Domain of unknown function (DUF4431)